jgi:hypothetical protein
VSFQNGSRESGLSENGFFRQQDTHVCLRGYPRQKLMLEPMAQSMTSLYEFMVQASSFPMPNRLSSRLACMNLVCDDEDHGSLRRPDCRQQLMLEFTTSHAQWQLCNSVNLHYSKENRGISRRLSIPRRSYSLTPCSEAAEYLPVW